MNRPIQLVEESLQILRAAGPAVLLPHWVGTLPFAITLLLLLQDVRLSWGSSLILRDSLFCALAFVWLSYWKSRASRTTFALLSPVGEPAVSSLGAQLIFQTPKLFVMPFAVVSLLAWPAASAFFRMLTLEPLSKGCSLRSSFGRALAGATGNFRETLGAALILAALAVVAFINVLAIFFALPTLWKILTGFETQWSTLGSSALPGLLVIAGVTTWILIDPWMHTYCLLRVFYLNARSDGRDLLRDISRLAAVALLCLLAFSTPASADDTQSKLNQSIDRAAQANDYGWLRPQASSQDNNFLMALSERIDHAFTAVGNGVKRWLRRIFNSSDVKNVDQLPSASHAFSLRGMLVFFAVIICGCIIALFLRRSKRGDSQRVPVAAAPAADILNEQLLASEVDQEEWLRLALQYMTNDETRLAARAFYLANLSYLGRQSLLSLSLTKTNKLYERELARHPKSSQLSAAFVAANRLYERAWYGMRELESEQMKLLQGAADQLRQYA